MPPIRKGDGTPVAPKGISQIRTGDGRILFDGVAIPDSDLLQAHWNTNEELITDNGDVSEIPDLTDNNNDLTGTISTINGDGFNGKTTVQTTGSSDKVDTDWSDLSPPFDYYGLVRYTGGGGGSSTELMFDSSAGDGVRFDSLDSGDEWRFRGGNSIIGGDVDTEWHIFSWLLRESGEDSTTRIDGSDVLTGDLEDVEATDFHFGARSDGDFEGDWELLEFMVYESSTTPEDVERYLDRNSDIL